MHSFADRFISSSSLSGYDPVYPLIVQLCSNCGFIQNKTVTNPNERYNDVVYSYTSSNSGYAKSHWKDYATGALKYLSEPSSSSVLEIGSNDGTLLGYLLDKVGFVVGVDASPYISDLARARGITTYTAVFGSPESKKAPYSNHKYDLIIANNVLNHSDDPVSFLSEVSTLLKGPDSVFMFELPYWKKLVDTRSFDQIYHEHVSYLTLENSTALLRQAGLSIVDVSLNEYHGGSVLIACSPNAPAAVDGLNDLLKNEEKSKLRDVSTYQTFRTDILRKKLSALNYISKQRLEGRPVVCVGAAAKANTLFNYYCLDSSLVDFVTDTSEHKIGKYTPLTRLPVLPDEAISSLDSPLCLITSWNISSTLESVVYRINSSAQVVSIHSVA